MLLVKLNESVTDASLETLERDCVLSGARGGVPWLFDLGSAYSWDGTVANAAPVKNIASSAHPGELSMPGGPAPVHAGGGLDFSACDQKDNMVLGPSAASAAVWAHGQDFLLAFWVRLPALADWSGTNGLLPYFQAAAGAYNTPEPEIAAVGIDLWSGRRMFARRQVGTDTVLTDLAVPDYALGQIAQVAFWRNNAGVGLRLKTATGVTVSTGARGADNTTDFSACRPRFGLPGNMWQWSGMPAPKKSRLYRGWIECLQVSGRDPVAALDADWARTISRGVFS